MELKKGKENARTYSSDNFKKVADKIMVKIVPKDATVEDILDIIGGLAIVTDTLKSVLRDRGIMFEVHNMNDTEGMTET